MSTDANLEELAKDRDYWRDNARFEHKRYFEQLQYAERMSNRAEGWRRELDALERELQLARISDSRLRQLLQLCHPDKHANSELANETTAWLLGLRRGGQTA